MATVTITDHEGDSLTVDGDVGSYSERPDNCVAVIDVSESCECCGEAAAMFLTDKDARLLISVLQLALTASL